MTLSINTKTFTANTQQNGAVLYVGPANTFTLKDAFRLSARAPRPAKDYSGQAVSQHKFTRTLPLTAALTPTGDAIVEISVSVPVGFASTDVDALLNDAGAYLSSATAKQVVKTGLVNF